jgi:hypothetical protein
MSEAWKISPIAKNTFGRLAVSMADVARKFREGTVIIADRHNADNSVTRVFLVPNTATIAKVGQLVKVVNAENNRPYGDHQVLGVIKYKFKNGILELADYDVGTAAYSEVVDETATVFSLN